MTTFRRSSWALLASLTALLLTFSQTVAFYGDEEVHLLAARVVDVSRNVYLDFIHPHALFIETGDPPHRVTRARPRLGARP